MQLGVGQQSRPCRLPGAMGGGGGGLGVAGGGGGGGGWCCVFFFFLFFFLFVFPKRERASDSVPFFPFLLCFPSLLPSPALFPFPRCPFSRRGSSTMGGGAGSSARRRSSTSHRARATGQVRHHHRERLILPVLARPQQSRLPSRWPRPASGSRRGPSPRSPGPPASAATPRPSCRPVGPPGRTLRPVRGDECHPWAAGPGSTPAWAWTGPFAGSWYFRRARAHMGEALPSWSRPS